MAWENTDPGETPQIKVSKRAWILAGAVALLGVIVIPTVLLWPDSQTPEAGRLPAWIAGYQTEPGSQSLDIVLALCPTDSIDDYEKTLAFLEERGLEVLSTSPENGQMWIADPDGHVIELIDPQARR